MKTRTVAKTRVKRFLGNVYQASELFRKGLPLAFTIPLVAAGGLYFLVCFPLLVYKVVPEYIIQPLVASVAEMFSGDKIPDNTWLGRVVWASIYLLSAVVTVILAVLGVFLSYYAAGSLYRLYRRVYRSYVRRVLRDEHVTQAVLPSNGGPPREGERDRQNPLAGYQRIGIILSGGGAKGAYQAGAMKAVYEFLEEHGAHDKVCMIAGTSIGSWNALFWLAGLIKERNGGPSPLERWWSSVNVGDVIQPVSYVPTRHNYFLSNEPWKEAFDDLFKDTPAGAQLEHHIKNACRPGTVNFYFTRSNIGKASLAYTTNRNSWDDVTPNLSLRRARAVEGDYLLAKSIACVRDGVFSSMDIPPLFEYSCDGDRMNFFEDGGVVDNLPIRFGTEIENCDLLFILPLNASFDRKVNKRSVFKRLARVTEIRQGVLERNSFKMIYLYNELAGLREELDTSRERVKELERQMREIAEGRSPGGEADASSPQNGKRLSEKKIAARAHTRSHRVVHVFSICPGPELKIYTTEFWKTKEAGEAFDFMYRATTNELRKFGKAVTSDVISTAIVGPCDPSRLEFLKEVDAGKNVLYEDTPEVTYRVEYFTDF